MYTYIHDKDTAYKVDFFAAIENGKTFVSVESPYYKVHHLKIHYKSPAFGGNPFPGAVFGYYVNLPLRDGRKKRVYMPFR